MPQFSLPASSITQGVTSLGNALFPTSSEGAIQGQLDGALFNQRTQAARASGARADTDQFYLDNRRQMVEMLQSNPDWLASPEGRALASSLAMGGGSDPRQVMEALPGAAVFTNPNVFEPDELSNVLVGTGVMSDYGNTPAGFSQDQARQTREADLDRAQRELGAVIAGQVDLEQTALQQEGMNLRHITPGAPASGDQFEVSPMDYQRIAEGVQSQLENLDMQLDEEETLWLYHRIDQLYAQTRNASEAANQAVREMYQAEQMVNESQPNVFARMLPGDQTGNALEHLPQIGQPEIAGPLVGGEPMPAETSSPYAALPPLVSVPPSVASIPAPAQGQTVVSPSTGMRLIFWDGNWREVPQ